MSNVLCISGLASAPAAKLPQDAVIAILEEYLEAAVAGELCGVVICGVTNHTHGYGLTPEFQSGSAPGHLLLAAAAAIEAKVKIAWLDMYEET